jgi:pimeloyl-ACP methyl ester carboxylesterase
MQYLTVHGNKIAYQTQTGVGVPVFWCGGYQSDMTGTKVAALAATNMPLTRFDYSGHGVSEGLFEEGSISRWLDEAEAVYRHTCENALIIGSSMGGWIALLLAKRVKAHALLLIAPAPDFTDKLSNVNLSARFIEDGRKNLLLDAPYDPGCPVHIMTGACDDVVPVSHVLKLVECLPAVSTQFTLVPGGDHRLSTPDNIALLLKFIKNLLT